MSPRLAHLLVLLYPRNWRNRYSEEFRAMLEEGPGGLAAMANVAGAALNERVFPTQGGNMTRNPGSFGAIIRHPSALIPIAMSLTALSLVVGAIATSWPPVREADEGAIAHLWQILMAGQLPILAFFAIKWLPRAPKSTLVVLTLQAGAALASMAPVFYFNL